ncbi:type II toxin-antitoxin system VapC family toxin [Microbacterium sp. KR10-403]|uniref:type II toxin-antitoxin system VapC family toxin n=1 Tax=Microbacterium sp. KR10-403 TaxID=3158581 RepID=UPI0032E3D81B
MPHDGDPLADEVVVVDASVVIALVASRSDAAARLAARLESASLHAPVLLPVEVDSGIRGLVLGRRLSAEQGTAARAAAHALPIDLWPWELLTDRAWELRENLSSYDAGYVALAERLNVPLLTGDARIARAAGARCTVEVFR